MSADDYGDCVVTRTVDERGGVRMRIERADPKIRITARLVHEIRTNNARGETLNATIDGDVLTLKGTNRTVIYRIGELDPLTDSYHAEWPD